MKNLTLIIISFLFFSCNSDNFNAKRDTTFYDANKMKTSSLNYFKKEVANTIEGTLKLSISKQEFIDWYANYYRKNEEKFKWNSVRLFQYNKQNYLQLKGGKERITFLLKLLPEKKNRMALDGISCKSIDCASDSSGCIPKNSTACTPCGGDCEKTVSLP